PPVLRRLLLRRSARRFPAPAQDALTHLVPDSHAFPSLSFFYIIAQASPLYKSVSHFSPQKQWKYPHSPQKSENKFQLSTVFSSSLGTGRRAKKGTRRSGLRRAFHPYLYFFAALLPEWLRAIFTTVP